MARTKGEQTRARILESGLELFLTCGSHAVSLRQIAGAAGLSPMAIYRHFEGKAELQMALLEHAFATFESFLQTGTGDEDPLEALRALARQFFSFAFERSPQFRFLFLSDARMVGPEQHAEVSTIARPSFVLLADCIQRCRDAGLIVSADTPATAVDILSFCVGRSALLLSGNLNAQREDAVAEAMEAFDRFLLLIINKPTQRRQGAQQSPPRP